MKVKLHALLLAALLIPSGAAFADQKTVSQLNELLRGEISATETYRQALEKVGKVPGSEVLRQNHEDHQKAVATLREWVMKHGGQPSQDSGAWGAWAKTVTGSAKVLGDKAALKALKEGEEHGIEEYKEVLENENVPAEVKAEIKETFIPAQEKHIQAINNLMDKA